MSDEIGDDETLDDLELDDDDEDSGSDNSAPPEPEESEDGDKKRINDLMSKWQAAEAEKEKLLKENSRLKQKPKAPSRKSAGGDDATAEFVQFTRESARKQLFDSDPRFGRFGLTSDAIAGDTLAEMKESFQAQVKLISAIESRTRNEVLTEHGLQPEVETGQGDEKAKDFASMTDKEFGEFLEERERNRFN